MFNWDSIIKYARDIGVILGLLVGLFALMNHWKTIFKPHSKRIEDQEFFAVETLLKAIRNYKFYILYIAKDNTINYAILEELLDLIDEPSANPFLPEPIYEACKKFQQSIYTSTNYFLLIFLKGKLKGKDSDKVHVLNKKDIFESHKLLHHELTKHLNLSRLSFNFKLSIKS